MEKAEIYMKSIKEVLWKTEKELAEIKKEAVSIGAYNIPTDPVGYMGSQKSGTDFYHYFRDAEHRCFYVSENTLDFDRQMREAQNRRKLRLRSYRKNKQPDVN